MSEKKGVFIKTMILLLYLIRNKQTNVITLNRKTFL